MQNVIKAYLVGAIATLFLLPSVQAQTPAQTSPTPDRSSSTNGLYNQLGSETGGPAPRRDLTGFWVGKVEPKLNEIPPMTPWGQEQFHQHKTTGEFTEADSNDPSKGCDPLGFPRNMLFMARGIAFAAMPDRMIEMFQFNRLWREIWTDGRELPKNVGGDSADSPDPRWYGYSVGHWDGDYTFVVDTIGSDERSWLDNDGHPHSIAMHVQERYTRVNHNNIEVTITIDDPKTYTKPFVITKSIFKWIPKQDFEEQLCVPSEEANYFKIISDPAAHGPAGK